MLARARGLEPVIVALPPDLASLSKSAFVEMRLVYDLIAKRHCWHLVVDDGVEESQAVHGEFGHVQVGSVKYRRACVRRSSPDTGHVAREAHPADGSREAAGL